MLFALIMVSITSLVIFIYHYANANTLRTINLSHVSLYMTSDTEHALKLNIATLTPLAQRIPHYEDEHVSILIGKEAISYFSIDNKNKLLSENIFLLRAGHPVMEEVQWALLPKSMQLEWN